MSWFRRKKKIEPPAEHAFIRDWLSRDVLKEFDRIEATFAPKEVDDLDASMVPFVGWRGRWIVGYRVTTGQYIGQWAMIPELGEGSPPCSWVPLCDLADRGPAD